MAELDLTTSIEQARKEAEAAALDAVDARLAAANAEAAVNEKRSKLLRLERAMQILNGEEPSTAAPTAQASQPAASEVPAAPPPTPPPRRRQPEGPYAGLRCGGCQEVGTMNESIRTLQNGSVYRALVCSDCSNELMLG